MLAAACFGTAAYGWTKYANVKAKNEYRWEYQYQYETLVTDSLQDIVAQYLYIKNFFLIIKKFMLKVVSMEI